VSLNCSEFFTAVPVIRIAALTSGGRRIEYTVPYGGQGLLFAQRVENLPILDETKKALRHLEKQLQDRYDPPLCNDTVAGRKLRDKWVKKHGWPVVIKKSEAVMTTIKTRICVAPDGTITGRASGLPPGEHEAQISLVDTGKGAARPDADALLARVRAIQDEMAQLPVLDDRSPDEIIGYNDFGSVGPSAQEKLDRLFNALDIEIAPFTRDQAVLAIAGYRQYGKGSGHAAALNFGDCFSYALAKLRDEPLLFKGDDSRATTFRAPIS